ncbi:MAG: SUMF1/EgtB/PvdO family nonheme iron enzyme, partial [Kiritimatiellae bacterium]|nr:SUMF1/EgtB/PvdO family nonheme iron enzyme [Kiritimatiellia bacterium]
MSGVGHSMRNCAFVALLVLNSFSLLAADDLKPIVIQMSRDVKMEFQPCPAGTFTMGKENDTKENSCTKAHKVTITRPFWMGKYKITHSQWNRISKPAKTYKGKSAEKSK